MKTNYFILFIITVLAIPTFSFAVNNKQLEFEKELTDIATSRCNSEFIQGKDYEFIATGDGGIKISLLGKKGGNLKGNFTYTKKEWEGRQRVLEENQHSESANRRKCIREEIKDLHKRYSPPQSVTQETNGKQPSSGQLQKFDTYFQNQFLRVDPIAIHKSEDNKMLIVSMRFSNISNDNILLAIYNKSQPVTLDDHNGQAIKRWRISGIPETKYREEYLDSYTTINKGSQAVVTIKFKSRKSINGNVFSLTIPMVKHANRGEKYSYFSVGIPNIEL